MLNISGTIMTISKDRVKPSPYPDSWKLAEIFTTGIVLGGYLAMMTVIFFWAAYKTDFFPVRKLFLNQINGIHVCQGPNETCPYPKHTLISFFGFRMMIAAYFP